MIEENKQEKLKRCTSFEELLDVEYGKKGSAERIGTKKSYISKVENGHTDVQLSTLFRIFEGLGKRVSLSIL